jgi:hypothetical protein
MKIIISNKQYRMLSESKSGRMQNLIDMALEQLIENCEGGYYIRSHQSYICDPIDMIEEIKVVDVSKSTSMDYFEKNKTESINITIDCYIDSIYKYNNLANFIYQLQEEARNVIGAKVIIISVRDIINKRKDFNF